MSGGIHSIRCEPGTEREKQFLQLLKCMGVNMDLVICKKGELFDTSYDEYYISDGLYRLIEEEFENIREI